MKTMFEGAYVTGLWRYPVSTLAGEQCASLQLDPDGPRADRTHGLFDAATGAPAYPVRDPSWNQAPALQAKVGQGGPVLSHDGQIWHDINGAATLEMLSKHFGRPVLAQRYGATLPDGTIAKARYNMAPVHLISRQALTQLERLLPDSQIDPRRFRPNIVVDLPYAPAGIPEYNLLGQTFRIGDVTLRGVAPCGRCGFTTLQQGDLARDPDVLSALTKHFQRNLGIYCVIESPGEIHIEQSLCVPRMRPIVIVGAGQAGAMTARTLRELGHQAPLHLIGDEPHAPYERPQLSKALFRTEAPTAAMTRAEAQDLNIDLQTGCRVVALDADARTLKLADGTRLEYARLVIATGGQARNPLELSGPRVRTLRTRKDAQAIATAAPRRLLVLGGGWIAMEAAAAARAAGIEVTVLVRGPALAHRLLPVEVTDHLAALHRANGVDLRLGVTPRFTVEDTCVRATIEGATVTADLLLVATGITPDDSLGHQAGIASGNGIATDTAGATSQPLIHAVGDVALQPFADTRMRIESWQNANDQSRACAHAMLGLPLSERAPLRFWSDQFGKRIQIAGQATPDAPLRARPADAARPFWNYGTFAVGIDRPQEIHQFDSYPASERANRRPLLPEGPGRALVASLAVPEGALIRVEDPVHGALALTRLDGQVHAVADACPHAVASLADGFVANGHIVCPLHFAEFALTDGTPRNAPAGCGRLACWPVSEAGGEILIHDMQDGPARTGLKS
ncbi:MAG: MOSC domain-containing protein [Halomonas sp.]|nr:FAD-dependent oxidoreductase [Halomonas sp.]TVP47002.1 MAG: MOSC domain-containing protein [Halomonas sp.]